MKNVQSGSITIHKLINNINERFKAIEDFKNKTIANIENVLKDINQKKNANNITNKKVEKLKNF